MPLLPPGGLGVLLGLSRRLERLEFLFRWPGSRVWAPLVILGAWAVCLGLAWGEFWAELGRMPPAPKKDWRLWLKSMVTLRKKSQTERLRPKSRADLYLFFLLVMKWLVCEKKSEIITRRRRWR